MSRGRQAEERRRFVLQSLEQKPSGNITTYGVKDTASRLGGTEVDCTVEFYCRTFIFEFPGSQLTSDEPIAPQLITKCESLKAVVVSDLPAYFQDGHSEFPHYAIDISLRHGVERVYRKEAEQRTPPQRPMFVVIEQYEAVPSTTFANGECFEIDERRNNGEEIVEGGRKGERALLAFRTCNGVWPDFSPDMQGINTVLVALKVEQDVTHNIEERYSCSCFVSDDGQAVYSGRLIMGIGYGGVRVHSPIDTYSLKAKVANIRSIHDGIKQDSVNTLQIAELADSVLLDKTQDDGYFRLWYLRLWQAAVESKKHLGEPGLKNRRNVVAGELTPEQLKDYRNDIAHWWTGKVDFSFVTGIQLTVLALLRRKYRAKD